MKNMSLIRLNSLKILTIVSVLALIISPTVSSVDALDSPFRDELRFTVRSLGWFPSSHKPTEILTNDIENIGIKFDLSAEESSVMYPAIFEHKDYDIFTLATSQSPPFGGMLDLFYGPEYYPWGGNDAGYNNSRYDELWKLGYTLSYGSAEHKAAVFEAQEMIQEEALWISWYTSDDIHFVWSEFTDYVSMAGGPFTDMNMGTILNMHHKTDPTQGFTMAMGGDVMQVNPMATTDLRTEYFEVCVYDSLLQFDENLNIIPWLAEDYSVSPDGLDWEFTIRSNAKWHDGTALTAEDVAWNFEYCYDNQVARYWTGIQFIDRDTIRVEGNVVKFSLTEPNTWFELGIPDLMILNPKSVPDGVNYLEWDDWADDGEVIGSGPFKLDSRIPAQSTKVVRNDNWWGTPPKLPWIGFQVIPDESVRFLSMKQGDVHTQRYQNSPQLIRSAQQDPNLDLVINPGVWLCYLEFNEKRVGDKVVRQAINYANNRADYINTAQMGWAIEEFGIISTGWHPDYVSPKLLPEGYELQAGDTTIVGTGELFYPFNYTLGNQLLDDAGYIDTDGDGIREIPEDKQYLFPKDVTWENPIPETTAETTTAMTTTPKTTTTVPELTISNLLVFGLATMFILMYKRKQKSK